MGFNNAILRADAAALIPEDVSAEVLQAVLQGSTVMKLGRKLPNMGVAQRRLPVMSALATAYFVSGETGLKQTSEVNWENKYLDAEEVACIIPIPESVLDDTSYDVWAQVKPAIVAAFGKAIDAAVLYGTNIPTSWTTNLGAAGIVARCTAASHTISLAAYADLYEALLGETNAGTAGLLALLEADGFIASSHVAAVSMRSKIRNTRDSEGNPIWPNVNEVDGAPVLYPTNGAIDSSTGLVISGDWSQLVFAVRQDVTYKILSETVITDTSGTIVYNLAQQDMVALRAVMRLGFALPNPINQMTASATTRCAFATLTA